MDADELDKGGAPGLARRPRQGKRDIGSGVLVRRMAMKSARHGMVKKEQSLTRSDNCKRPNARRGESFRNS